MKRVDRYKAGDGNPGIGFDCPGCGVLHVVPVEGPRAWGFNGSLERPTLTPSLLVRWTMGEERREHVCHSFVRDGRIQFLTDCTHARAGQTVDLSEVP